MIAAVKDQAETEVWTKEGGKFIPHPATWINGRRWEDEIKVAKIYDYPCAANGYGTGKRII